MSTVAAEMGEAEVLSNHAVRTPHMASASENHEASNETHNPASTLDNKNNEKVGDGELAEALPVEETPGDTVLHLGPLRFSLLTFALCLSMFLPALDESIIAVAIPKMTDEFHSLNDVGWYASAYLLTVSAFQFFYGKCYSYFSHKWVFIAAVCIFELGSIVCASAPSSNDFIVGRAIAGLGCAGVVSGAYNIIGYTVSIRQRAAYTGVLGAITSLSTLAGPVLGGAFTDSHLTWRWCFWINAPLGGATLIILLLCLPPPKVDDSAKSLTWRQKLIKLDLGGTFLFLPTMVCLLLALQFGGNEYAWGNVRVIILLVLFVILLACFVAYEYWMKEDASLPVRVIAKKNVSFGAFFVFCTDGAYYVMIYYLPIWFQAIKGKTAEQSGISVLPFVTSTVLTYMSVGFAVMALGYYHPFMIGSTVFIAVGSGLLTTLQPSSSSASYIGYQILFGLGIGLGTQLPLIASQAVLAEADLPLGTAVIIFLQILGPAIFVPVGQNVFSARLLSGLEANIPGFHNTTAIANSGALGIQALVSPAFSDVVVQVYNKALTETWYIAVALAGLSAVGALGMDWKKLPKPEKEVKSDETSEKSKSKDAKSEETKSEELKPKESI